MSVNGDLVVMRNGRSTSQVSVYNYPEHLNPFYEDDNHKRLRFWKVNKSGKDGPSRRGSFSLNGLKDIWAFKTFRMKKKSSSLGINKTSESPPPMRRQVYANENGYGTYDPRMRYTTGPTNNYLTVDSAFQRNATYRSSLQDMRTTQASPSNGIGFNRNDRYRSTVQPSGSGASTTVDSLVVPPPRRYVYRGSVTPQPVRNNDFNSNSMGMISRGSSQVSVASSTNPFEDDDDDDVILGNTSTDSTPSKRPARKKRRAPPPPVPVSQIIKEESSSASSTPSHKSPAATGQGNATNTISEDQHLEIKHLTAEIESFVKLLSSDNAKHDPRFSARAEANDDDNESNKQPSTSKQNGSIPKDGATPAQAPMPASRTAAPTTHVDSEPLFIREDGDIDVIIKKVDEIKKMDKTSPIKSRSSSKESSPVKIIQKETKSSSKESSPVRVTESVGKQTKSPVKEVGHVETIHVHVESARSSPEKTEPSRVTTFRSDVKSKSPEKVVITTTKSTVEVHRSPEHAIEELRITSGSPEKPPIATKPNIPRSTPPVSPKLSGTTREGTTRIETPATPAMKRKEIKVEEDLPSTPQTDRKPKPVHQKEVTITTISTAQIQEQPSTSKPTPVPAVREHKHTTITTTTSTSTSPPQNSGKLLQLENENNLSTKQQPKPVPVIKTIEVEEKKSNLDVVVPTTVVELQLKISESDENLLRLAQPASDPPTITKTGQEPIVSSQIASTSTTSTAIKKPPRRQTPSEELPSELYRPSPSQWKQSTLAPLEPVPPEKRKSVKQIIESINRSQKLLNGKKENEGSIEGGNTLERDTSESNINAMEQNLKSLAESQSEMKRILAELDHLENTYDGKIPDNDSFREYLDTVVTTLSRDESKKPNAEVFKKDTITKEFSNSSRESSPTSSNLDWNPVPKPKRTKNLSPELEVKKNNTNNGI